MRRAPVHIVDEITCARLTHGKLQFFAPSTLNKFDAIVDAGIIRSVKALSFTNHQILRLGAEHHAADLAK